MTGMLFYALVILFTFALALPAISGIGSRDIDPILMKAYVFSKIMDSRYHGGYVKVDENGVVYLKGGKVFRKKFKAVWMNASGFNVMYRMRMIVSAGTVYFKNGRVSFLPVTGNVVVEMK